jgi:IPP transferase
VQAARLHPSDRRKVEGKIEIFLRTGKPASEIFREQAETEDFQRTRWNTLIFWVWAEKETLFERLDGRVDRMVAAGVEEECRELYEVSKQTDIPLGSGIFAAIGRLLLLRLLVTDNRVQGISSGCRGRRGDGCGSYSRGSNCSHETEYKEIRLLPAKMAKIPTSATMPFPPLANLHPRRL